MAPRTAPNVGFTDLPPLNADCHARIGWQYAF
ncbi:hypothetical protein ACSSV6_002208 [Roseovarius sp. MBR-38]